MKRRKDILENSSSYWLYYIKLNVRSTLISDRKQKFSNWFVYFGGTPRSIDPRQTQTQQFPLAIRRENSWLPLGRRERQGWSHGSPRGINIQRESTIISRELSLESRIQDSSRHRAVHLWNQWLSKSCNFYLRFLYFFVCRMLFRFGRRGYSENELDVRWGPWIIT